MLNPSPHHPVFPVLVPMGRRIRALLLDDSNFDRARIRRMSDRTNLSIDLHEVESIAQLDAAVARDPYDLILIDYRLPVGDGLEALDHVLRNAQNCDAGKIMITGDGARETAVQAMRGGCHDFLIKEEMDPDGLRRAMLNALETAQQRQQLIRHAAQQRAFIRDGLVAALQDRDVQDNVISLVRSQFADVGRFVRGAEAAQIDALLAAFADDDDFVFH